MKLIDKEALLKRMQNDPLFDLVEGYGVSGVINAEPTVDAEPVRHGKWKQWDSYGFEDTYKCTACGESFVLIEGTPITNGYKYCPNCGAKMDVERKDDETN